MTTRFLRQSELSTYMDCMRRWWLQYHRGLTAMPDPTKPATGRRDVGTGAHAGLAAYYRNLDPLGAVDDWVAGIERDAGATLGKEWQKDIDLVRTIVEGYVEWVDETGADAMHETLAVELDWKAYAGNYYGDDVWIYGAADRVYRDIATGLITIQDHKTDQSISRGPWFQMDFQGRTYAWGLASDPDVRLDADRFEHNILRKVGRSKQAKPPFYGRPAPLSLVEAKKRNHEKHLGAVVGRIVHTIQAMEAGADHHFEITPRATKDCDWKCDFVYVCDMLDDGSHAEAYLTENYVTIDKRTA